MVYHFSLTGNLLYIKIKLKLNKYKKMNKLILFLVSVYLASSWLGCASLSKLMSPPAQVEPTAGVQALPPYSGPKARIAIADFKVKDTDVTSEVGAGLREMLFAALINSNRFSVVERQVKEAPIKELDEAITEALEQAAKPEQDKKRIADIIITAAVTEFRPQASGGRSGVGGGGGAGNGVLGAMSGGALNKAHLALQIRVIDASSAEVIATTSVEGQASDISGAIMAGFLGNWSLGTGLSAYANTPMEKAIRICIIEAV